jgi:hypothetical protein
MNPLPELLDLPRARTLRELGAFSCRTLRVGDILFDPILCKMLICVPELPEHLLKLDRKPNSATFTLVPRDDDQIFLPRLDDLAELLREREAKFILSSPALGDERWHAYSHCSPTAHMEPTALSALADTLIELLKYEQSAQAE